MLKRKISKTENVILHVNAKLNYIVKLEVINCNCCQNGDYLNIPQMHSSNVNERIKFTIRK